MINFIEPLPIPQRSLISVIDPNWIESPLNTFQLYNFSELLDYNDQFCDKIIKKSTELRV